MKLVKMNNGEVRNVTSRHADQLVAAGKAEYFEAKEEKKAIETKEEKKTRRTKKQ